MKKYGHHKRCFFLVIILLIISMVMTTNFYESKNLLRTTSYKIQTVKMQKSIRLTQITDLHNSIFGVNNQELVDLI